MKPEIHYPVTIEDAAILFREMNNTRKAGESARVGIVESPYKPAAAADAETVLVSCRGMNRILEVSSGDMLAVVEGGVTHADLMEAVRGAGLYFPHVPRGDIRIAEMIMGGAIFPTEGAFGGLRESILSVELITPSAEVVRFGSRAIKDVGGYEIIGFLMGQGGRCGMITRVTLRLLAEPCCRAFIAGRGGGRALKTLAHNLREEFRPASIEIFEGEISSIVLDAWANALPSGDSKLSHLLDAKGDSLLVGELQGLEQSVEDQLHRLVDSSESEQAAFVLASEELHRVSRRYPLTAAADRGKAAARVCYDGPSGIGAPPGSFLCRSLYPERLEVFVPVEELSEEPVDTIRSDPELARFISSVTGAGRREQISIIEYVEGNIDSARVTASGLLDLAEEYAGGNVERIEELQQARLFEELNSRVLQAFDPDRIMLP